MLYNALVIGAQFAILPPTPFEPDATVTIR